MSGERESRADAQITSSVLMIRPARFRSNPETAGTNAFQHPGDERDVLARAQREFDGLVAVLRAHGVDVHVAADTPEPEKPDAVFPNNWVSFHDDGTVVLYPLLAENRRHEVRLDLVSELERDGRFARRRVVDLRSSAKRRAFLEGTGSLVLDRATRQAFACLSPRTSPALLERFCRELDYRPFAFHARDARGVPVYHTNVLLSIGERVAMACLEAVEPADERAELARRLTESGRELVAIDRAQMAAFAGNVLQLRARDGARLVVLSARARDAFTAEQRRQLERHGTLVASDLDAIERHGGGSARCMIAEVFGGAETRNA